MTVPVIILLFFIFLALAVPISSALAMVASIPGAFNESFTASGGYVVRSMISGIDSFPLLAIPMFVLSGVIMAKGGISKKLFEVCLYFIGHLTAGMPWGASHFCLRCISPDFIPISISPSQFQCKEAPFTWFAPEVPWPFESSLQLRAG